MTHAPKATLLAALILGFATAFSQSASAQAYPTKPITIVSSAAPGAPFDLLLRLFAEHLRKAIGVPIIVESVTGGQGLSATLRVLNSKSDGYSLIAASGGLSTTPFVMKSAGYKPEDFVAISPIGQVPYILFASSGVPASDVPSFMAHLKSHAKDINSGVLTTSYLSMLLSRKFSAFAGGDLTEIGYRGSPEMVTALMANDIQMMATTYSIGGPQLASGKIKAIGVVAEERTKNLPDLPTFKEQGYPSMVISIRSALHAKADVPTEILAKLRSASQTVISDAGFKKAMEAVGTEPWNVPIDMLQKDLEQEAKIFKDEAARFNLKIE